MVGRTGRVSKNEQWYRDFFAEHNRAPSQKEIRELAVKRLTEGVAKEGMPPDTDFVKMKTTLDKLNILDAKLHGTKIDPSDAKIYQAVGDIEGAKGVRKSKAFERVKARMLKERGEEIESAYYQKINLDDQIKKSTDFTYSSPEDAIRIAKGLKKAPEGHLSNTVSMATEEKLREEGKRTLANEIAVRRSLRLTRYGQEIVSEKASIYADADYYIKKVLDERRNIAGRKVVSEVGEKKASLKVKEAVERETSKLKETLKKASFKIEDAQKLLDNLTCK